MHFLTNIAKLCLAKVDGLMIRLYDFFRLIPLRLGRLLHHLVKPFLSIYRDPKQIANLTEHFFWFVELIFYLGDLLGIGEIYETLAAIIKFNARPLNDSEIALARKIFNDRIDLRRIRLDEFSFLGPKTHDFAYVSFCTINSWGPLKEDILIHELVHVWQYQQMGAVYIPRALRAQFSPEGYDYGGLSNLLLAIRRGQKLQDFNLEQQGDIIADYFRLLKGEDPRWGGISKDDLWVYEHFLGNTHQGDVAA